MIFLGVNDSREYKLSVLKALTRKYVPFMCIFVFLFNSLLSHRFKLDEAVNLKSVAKHLPDHLTGADLYALCSNAVLKSVERNINRLREGTFYEFLVLILVSSIVYLLQVI